MTYDIFMRLFLVLLLLLIPIALAAFAWYDYQSPGPLAQEKTVVIPRNTGVRAMAELLQENAVIDHAFVFDAAAVITGKTHTLKAGEYLFPAEATLEQVIDMLVSGKVVVHKITVPEGWRVLDVLEMLTEQTLLTGDMAVPAEGTLLPETYHYLRGDARREVIARMQADMSKQLAELWAKRKEGLLLASPEQAVVLASIVEKETGLPEERPHIASVFLNRLKKNMPLQSDPTVVYAIEKDKGAMNRALTTADLKVDSPYNTYKSAGLPPAPICNPGRAALEAVLNPPDTDDLYFVATGTGGHNFASSIKEHNKNVKKYREELKRQKQP
jgi:UPF0755 protein